MNRLLAGAYGSLARAADMLSALTPDSFGGKAGRAFSARRGLRARYRSWANSTRDRSQPLLWMHAASVGEGMMALPLIQRVRRAMPSVQIAYTFFSPSAEPTAAQIGADFTDYIPFDSVASARSTLAALDPTALVFTKGDVWPNLVREASADGVRLGLVSASMPPRSLRARSLGALLTHDAYAALDAVGAASTGDAEQLVRAGARASHVRVTGDTRYDQAWTRAHKERVNRDIVERLASGRPTVVAGSTWRSDDRELLPAWLMLRAAVPDARIMIAPHELTAAHIAFLEGWARDAALSVARLDSATTDTDVVIVDRMGVLADLYALATAAYVGGGFHDSGLHSLVEPAVFRVPVIVGPRNEESRDAQIMLRCGGAVSAHSAVEFSRILVRLLSDAEERTDRSEAIGSVVATELGAADRSFDIIRELLRPV